MTDGRRRSLARAEATLSVVAAVLASVTIFWRDWIEAVTGWDPDRHSGAVELAVICGLATVSVGLGLVARRTWVLVGAEPVSST